MSIKINTKNNFKYKLAPESGAEAQPQLVSTAEQPKITAQEAQSKLSRFINGVREAASQKLKTSSVKRQFKSTTEGVKEGDELQDALNYAKYKERTRNPIAVGIEKGRAYLNATAEVGAKNGLEFAKNDIDQTKADLKNLFQKGAEGYMAGQSFMRKDIAKTKEDVNSTFQKGAEAFMAGQSFVRKDIAQTKENFDRNAKIVVEAGRKGVEATVGAVVQMGEGAKVLNKMAAEGLDSSREKGFQAIKWLGGKGREAWGSLKSMKENLIQGGKDKITSAKRSMGEKLIQKGMEMRAVNPSATTENVNTMIPQVEGLVDSFTPEDSTNLRLLTELSSTMLKYNDPKISQIHKVINKIDFADPSASQQVFSSLKDLYETGIVSQDDFNKIRNTVNELIQ
jgi:hypothetical protein